MKKWIRAWLGIDDLQDRLRLMNLYLERLEYNQISILKLKPQIEIALVGIGKIIAKLEPLYAVDELDKDRKKASDNLGDEIITRLLAEDAARKHTLGEP